MTTLFDVLNVNPAESVQPVQPAGVRGIAQTLAGVAGRGARQSAGQDTRPTGQRVAEATQGTDPNDPASLIAAAQRLDAIGESQRAIGLRQMAAQARIRKEQAAEEAQRKEVEGELFSLVEARATALDTPQALITSKALQAGQITALEALENLEAERPTGEDHLGRLRYLDSGELVFDADEDVKEDRDIREAANGVLYYVDDGSFVFPEVGGEQVARLQEEELERIRGIEDEQLRAEQADQTVLDHVSDIRRNVDTIRELVAVAPEGYLGSVAAKLSPTSTSGQIRRVIETLQSNIGFDKLQAMRDASPTGGALGQVSERELSNLQAVLGSLDARSTDEELNRVLDQVVEFYDRFEASARAVQNQRTSRTSSQAPRSTMDDVNAILGAPTPLIFPR